MDDKDKDMTTDKAGATPEGLDIDLLDLLRRLASGEGGRRTGALKRAGYLEWTVTEAGRAALGAAEVEKLSAMDLDLIIGALDVVADGLTLVGQEYRSRARVLADRLRWAKAGRSPNVADDELVVAQAEVGTLKAAVAERDEKIATMRAALTDISEKLPCESPCVPRPETVCGVCGKTTYESWCAGCTARGAL